jgi:predicted ATP-grasp superfamily ATP-dependent carboligase
VDTQHRALVLGLSETGLGVGRSLGRRGIKVIGLDYEKGIGTFSRYIQAMICPHPIHEENKFISHIIHICSSDKSKPVLFITDDNFLNTISKNRALLHNNLLFILPEHRIIESILDKYQQYKIAQKSGTLLPKTYFPQNENEIYKVCDCLEYPAFIKGRDTTQWRPVFGAQKGFVANNREELIRVFKTTQRRKVDIIVQEIIKGPDKNHYKICVYISKDGRLLLSFTLQKVRQLPIRFGVGMSVQSIYLPELMNVGLEFFKNINYRGVGSVEFKLDETLSHFKMIELNPRYWQQNILADACGMNFPLMQYLDLTSQDPMSITQFKDEVKWINIFGDFRSFWHYRKSGEINFKEWVESLRGKIVLSDFAWDDILPFIYRMGNVPNHLVFKKPFK